MRKLLPIAGAIIACCLFGFGQKSEKLSCPIVVVNGPSGIVDPGKTANFTVDIQGANEKSEYEYIWVVEPNRKFEGQGTATIRVEFRNYETITAAVSIKGLPSGCPNNASETYIIDILRPAEKIGEILGVKYVANKSFADNIYKKLQQEPNSLLYVMLQFNRGTSQEKMNRISKRLVGQLKRSMIEPDRMRFEMADNGNHGIVFWLVPPGSPKPDIAK